jgi:Protein of unknown function (DUF1501)
MKKMTRRDFLWGLGGGLGGIALADLLSREGQLFAATKPAATLDYPPKAKRVVQMFMSGGASHVDMFDYKPELIKRHEQPFDIDGEIELFQSDPGTFFKSPWDWKQYGESGKWMSDLVPHLAECVDDIAFIHSMKSNSNIHGPATFMQNSGFVLPGFPSMGSWVTYGLGSMTDDLPTFVVLPDSRGFAPNGPGNWSSGFLPAAAQGTLIRPDRDDPIYDLYPRDADFISEQNETDTRDLLRQLNEMHSDQREGDSRLDARIESYELAARLQLSAPEALDLTNESEATKKMYGLDEDITRDFGRNCLTARRLLERDVRFVQIWSGADNGFPRRNWDSHEDIPKHHGEMGRSMDKPAAALLKDLKSLGMLDDTIVIWTTEFGRMPCRQGGIGRDHNPEAFTSWVAGGGFKGGTTYGASDAFGYKAEENPTYCYDLHATILHQLGIDHEKLTFKHNGIQRRLTDVHGHLIPEILG